MSNPRNYRDALTIMVAIAVLFAARRLAHGIVLDLIYACDTALMLYLVAVFYRLERDDQTFASVEERFHLPRYAFTAVMVVAAVLDVGWWLAKIAV
jgi:cytochrome c biogenesis protein CcdA